MIRALPFVLCCLLLTHSAAAQPAAAPRPSEIALAPTRFELPMAPGTEQTVVVNVISSGSDANAKPTRLLASLGDWTLTPTGDMSFAKPGTTPGSAAPWMIYSPVELSVTPGKTYPIRVTISVPKDATPGDHLAVLFVEERPGDIKTKKNVKQLTFHFRLAAVFYVMVTPLNAKGALAGLQANVVPGALEVIPTLRNEGNTHLRPAQSFQLLDASGKVVLEQEPSEGYPLLGGGELKQAMRVPQSLAAGEYSLRYRVDFKDGSKVIEGRTRVTVPAAPGPKPSR